MSLKELLGINKAGISDAEIVARLTEAQRKNLDFVELSLDGDVIKISIPHIGFDPDADRDSW
jgi:hypothetical protein